MTVTLTLHPASKTDAMRLERPRFVDEVPPAIELAREYGYSATLLASDWWGLENPHGALRTVAYGAWLLFRDGQLVQILTDEEYRAAHR